MAHVPLGKLVRGLPHGLRSRFGNDWLSNRSVGERLSGLFARGGSLGAEAVAAQLGFAPRLDFDIASTHTS